LCLKLLLCGNIASSVVPKNVIMQEYSVVCLCLKIVKTAIDRNVSDLHVFVKAKFWLIN